MANLKSCVDALWDNILHDCNEVYGPGVEKRAWIFAKSDLNYTLDRQEMVVTKAGKTGKTGTRMDIFAKSDLSYTLDRQEMVVTKAGKAGTRMDIFAKSDLSYTLDQQEMVVTKASKTGNWRDQRDRAFHRRPLGELGERPICGAARCPSASGAAKSMTPGLQLPGAAYRRRPHLDRH